MEKKYPVLKCNEELWNEIKPVLESFGINDFSNIKTHSFDVLPYILTNFGWYNIDKFVIGNLDEANITKDGSLRYLVDTKEEFLSAVAKLLNKEYPVKENKQDAETKYPCIKCTQQLYDKIKDILIDVGYIERNMDEITFDFVYNSYLVVNYSNEFGIISNIKDITKPINNRYLCFNIREFLIKACELKGFEVVYNTFVTDNDVENHYFKYVIDNNVIEINEIREDKRECSATAFREKQWRKKPKKEDMTVNCDPAIGESSTVVVTMPAKGNDFDKNKESDLDIDKDKDKDMKKINIANKLKHCKKGTKLYSLMFGEVKFNKITDDEYICFITIDKHNNEADYYVNSYATYDDEYPNGECLLFPSKDNRDWNNFQVLEEGHRVMTSDNGEDWYLRKYINNHICYCISDKNYTDNWKYIVPVEDFDFAAEDITINKEKSII